MKYLFIALLAFIFFPVTAAPARDRLVFSTLTDSGLTLVEEPIMREAYRRLGYDIAVRQYPGDRALEMADSGRVDGELARLPIVQEKYSNLRMVPVALRQIKEMAFTREITFTVKGWESLRPYTVVTLQGYKYTEQKLREHNIDHYLVPSYQGVLKNIAAGRCDIGLLILLDGLKGLHDLELTDIRILEPPVATSHIFHFVHKRHARLIPGLAAAITELHREGFIDRIESQVIAALAVPPRMETTPRPPKPPYPLLPSRTSP